MSTHLSFLHESFRASFLQASVRAALRVFLLACGLSLVCCDLLHSQALDFPEFLRKKDNFSKIQDKAIRAEVASFALAAVDESIGKAPLKTIPIANYGSDF